MKDRFDYADLKDMAETFARDNESMALRVEVIKEICELPEVNIPWSKLNPKILVYYAENPVDRLPCAAWWFKRAIVNDVGLNGAFRPNEKTGKIEFDVY